MVPSSMRPDVIRGEAYYLQHSRDEAMKEEERAWELGRGQAAIVQPLLAQCFAERGEKDRAISILQAYLKERPADAAAKKQLESLRNPQRLVPSPAPPLSTNQIETPPLQPPAQTL